jgi:quaternary ammonium compound-resistance protein SugE
MAWIFLLTAGLLEVAWAVGLNYAQGFTRLVPTVFTGVTLLGSMFFLGLAVRDLPIGTAYAIWVGIGAVGTAALGIVLFNESRDFSRLFFLGLIIVALVGLKLTTK